jgi:hypothetical protein
MRQGQQNKRMRGRGHRKGPSPLSRNYESNGGDVKIRGTALHIAEKYVQLARDAQSSGDRVAAENYLQHAEHYYRLVAAAQAQMPQPQPFVRSDEEVDEDDERMDGGFPGDRQPFQGQGGQPGYGGAEPQPYFNGNGQAGPDEDAPRHSGGQDGQPRYEGRDRGDRGQSQGERSQGDRGQQGDRSQGDRGQGEPRGEFRGRRRRPYRERYSDQAGAVRGDAPEGGASEAPAGEE